MSRSLFFFEKAKIHPTGRILPENPQNCKKTLENFSFNKYKWGGVIFNQHSVPGEKWQRD
jgi:hypothetical protein